MQRPLTCHRHCGSFSGTIISKFNAYFMWWRTKKFSYMSFPFGSKSRRVISTGKCIAPWVSTYTSFRVEFQCHVHSMKSRKYKEPGTEENLKQLSATNISEEAKGEGKHFYYQKIFSPFINAFSYQEMIFPKVNFLTRLSSFPWSFLAEKWFSIEWRIHLFLLHCFDRDCLRKGSSWGNFDFFTGVLFCKI